MTDSSKLSKGKKVHYYDPKLSVVNPLTFRSVLHRTDPPMAPGHMCITTPVLRYDVETGEIETLNTIYKVQK